MKVLRLYVDNQLDKINWTLLENDVITRDGTSTFSELSSFESMQVEVYLSAICCSIFKTNKVAGISNRKISDELILGLIEDNLVDDIEMVKPIVMREEDDLAYVAVFNRSFYDSLMLNLINLDKPIKLVQSFVYATEFNEDDHSWVIYLGEDQRFIRTSFFEYYLLDDEKPIPKLLNDMLNSNTKPDSIIVYSNEKYNLKSLQDQFGVNFYYSSSSLQFGHVVWNFYNQKSRNLKLTLESTTIREVTHLLNTVKYLLSIFFILWVANLGNTYIHKYKLEKLLLSNLNKITPVTEVSPITLNQANEKLNYLVHSRGLYYERDFVPMLAKFLSIVTNINPNDIAQIDYDESNLSLTIYLSQFDPNQFQGYKEILHSEHILASLAKYKDYIQKTSNENSGANSKTNDPLIVNNVMWVVSLKSDIL